MTVYRFLSYHDEIPNKELMMKFEEVLEDKSMDEVSQLVLKSNEMLKATIRRDTETMAALLEETHDINTPMIRYNDENSLACVVILAYLSARTKYKIIREMPAEASFYLGTQGKFITSRSLTTDQREKIRFSFEGLYRREIGCRYFLG